jgi:hypothetical protein
VVPTTATVCVIARVGVLALNESMRDTTGDAEHVRLTAIRAMSPADRLRQAIELSEAARRLAVAGLRARYPGLSEAEIAAMYAGIRLPDVVPKHGEL